MSSDWSNDSDKLKDLMKSVEPFIKDWARQGDPGMSDLFPDQPISLRGVKAEAVALKQAFVAAGGRNWLWTYGGIKS